MASKDDHMRRKAARSQRPTRHPTATYLATLLTLAPLSGLGCQRVLLIKQDDLVNNAMHQDRPDPRTWEGQPLHVDIVCVNASDLKDDRNARLKPDSSITCSEWYASRPDGSEKDEAGGTHFKLPRSHIIMLSDDRELYGTPKFRSLRGALVDSEKVEIRFSFPGSIFDDKSVIFVFPRFEGKGDELLPVPPARFDPPGAYRAGLAVKIGVDEKSRPFKGQYVETITERKGLGEGYQHD